MARTATTTAFVTGATGLIGTALVRVLVARGHRVYGLTRSVEAAQRVRRAGAVPVMGNLLEPGLWQDVAAADWVFHLPPPSACGLYVTTRAAGTMSEERVSMDRHLLDALSGVATRRIVYAASAGAYGATGPIPVTEDAPPRPSAWGRTLAPALDRLDGYLVTGLPIVTALPGWVYGNGSWFRARVLEPILAGRPVLQIGTPGPWVSPIHVTDCARALTHLAERGAVGGRYFLVNDEAMGRPTSRPSSPGSPTGRCACGGFRPWPSGSPAGPFRPTTSGPTACSRTSGCARSASASSIRRS